MNARYFHLNFFFWFLAFFGRKNNNEKKTTTNMLWVRCFDLKNIKKTRYTQNEMLVEIMSYVPMKFLSELN